MYHTNRTKTTHGLRIEDLSYVKGTAHSKELFRAILSFEYHIVFSSNTQQKFFYSIKRYFSLLEAKVYIDNNKDVKHWIRCIHCLMGKKVIDGDLPL